jgi:hypothetical protein
MSLLLHHDRSAGQLGPMANVADTRAHQVATSKFAVELGEDLQPASNPMPMPPIP